MKNKKKIKKEPKRLKIKELEEDEYKRSDKHSTNSDLIIYKKNKKTNFQKAKKSFHKKITKPYYSI